MKNKTQCVIFDFSQKSVEELVKRAKPYLPSDASRQDNRNPEVYRSFLGGRVALAQLLQEKNLSFQIRANASYGFLELFSATGECTPNWFCSVSHTEFIAVAALSDAPVGVDIESKKRSVEKVLSRIASPEELNEFQQAAIHLKEDLAHPSLLLWTAKEAFSKASGLGMRKGLEDFRIHWSDQFPLRGSTPLETPRALKEPTISFVTHQEFLIGLCCEKKSNSFDFR